MATGIKETIEGFAIVLMIALAIIFPWVIYKAIFWMADFFAWIWTQLLTL